MTPEKFAEYICLDLNLNPSQHQGTISRSIRGQLKEYKKYFLYSDLPIPQDTRTIIKVYSQSVSGCSSKSFIFV